MVLYAQSTTKVISGRLRKNSSSIVSVASRCQRVEPEAVVVAAVFVVVNGDACNIPPLRVEVI